MHKLLQQVTVVYY